MAKAIKYVTAKGTALFPHLRKPEIFDGQDVGYTIKVVFSQEETDKLIAFLEKELEKCSSLPEFKGKSFTGGSIGVGEYKDDTYIKFKTNSEFTTKTGEVIKRTVPVFDAKNKPLPEDIEVGNGSVVRVAYSIFPFWKSRTVKGLSLRLEGVQVLELKEWNGGADAESLGFDVEDGYSVEAANTMFPPSDDELNEIGKADF